MIRKISQDAPASKEQLEGDVYDSHLMGQPAYGYADDDEEDFNVGFHEGDVYDDLDDDDFDEFVGDVEEFEVADLSPEDVGNIMFEGGPLRKKIRKKVKKVTKTARQIAGRTPVGRVVKKVASLGKSGIAAPRAAAFNQKVASIAKGVTAGLQDANFPHLAVANGTVHTVSTDLKIPGGSLKALIEKFALEYPMKSLDRHAVGDASGSLQKITLTPADATELGYSIAAIPVIFVTITSKSDSVRPGASIGLHLIGTSHTSGTLEILKDTVRRTSGDSPLELQIQPVMKRGDRLAPVLAVFGTNDGDDVTLELHITGLLDGDIATITTPGYDSVSWTNYLRNFNLNL